MTPPDPVALLTRAFDAPGRRKYAYAALAAITGCGGLLRIVFYLRDPLVSRDGLYYFNQYSHWLEAKSDGPMNPMLFHMFQAGEECGFSPVATVVWCNIVLGILLIPVVYAIGCSIWKRASAGLICALLIAINYALIRNCVEVQRESGYLLFWGSAFWCLCQGCLKDFRRDWEQFLWWGGAGFCAAFAALFRYEAYEIPLLGFLFLVIWGRLQHWRIKRMMLCFLAFLLLWGSVIGGFSSAPPEFSSDTHGLGVRISFYLKRLGL